VLQAAPSVTTVTELPTFDLHSVGLGLILTGAINALADDDRAQREELIEKGQVSGKARYVGLDERSGFAVFEWAGRPLVLINPEILPRVE
jgi:hypothetical protein